MATKKRITARANPSGHATPKAQLMRESRARREGNGGRQITVMLSPVAAAKLARFELRHEAGTTEVINALLEQSAYSSINLAR